MNFQERKRLIYSCLNLPDVLANLIHEYYGHELVPLRVIRCKHVCIDIIGNDVYTQMTGQCRPGRICYHLLCNGKRPRCVKYEIEQVSYVNETWLSVKCKKNAYVFHRFTNEYKCIRTCYSIVAFEEKVYFTTDGGSFCWDLYFVRAFRFDPEAVVGKFLVVFDEEDCDFIFKQGFIQPGRPYIEYGSHKYVINGDYVQSQGKEYVCDFAIEHVFQFDCYLFLQNRFDSCLLDMRDFIGCRMYHDPPLKLSNGHLFQQIDHEIFLFQ